MTDTNDTLGPPSYDIRTAIGPYLDAAIQTARAPGERWAWDISSALVVTNTGAIGVQFVVYLVAPSPVLGNTITALEEVNPLTLLEGNTALDLIRRLIENGRQARSSVLASPLPPLGAR